MSDKEPQLVTGVEVLVMSGCVVIGTALLLAGCGSLSLVCGILLLGLVAVHFVVRVVYYDYVNYLHRKPHTRRRCNK